MGEIELDELSKRVEGLESLATGQAAMMALLSALLVKHQVLSPQEAMLVATAGVDTQQFEGLSPVQVGDWVRGLLSDLGKGDSSS